MDELEGFTGTIAGNEKLLWIEERCIIDLYKILTSLLGNRWHKSTLYVQQE